MKSRAMIVQHGSRIIPMTIRWTAGTPVVVEGTYHANVVDTGDGIVTVTFALPFARKPVIVTGSEADTGKKVTAIIRNVTQAGFILESILEVGDEGDSPLDVHLLIVGFDAVDES